MQNEHVIRCISSSLQCRESVASIKVHRLQPVGRKQIQEACFQASIKDGEVKLVYKMVK